MTLLFFYNCDDKRLPTYQPHAPPQTAASTVHTLLHCYTAIFLLDGAPHICPTSSRQIITSCRSIPKPNYLPYPWTHLTYRPKLRHMKQRVDYKLTTLVYKSL